MVHNFESVMLFVYKTLLMLALSNLTILITPKLGISLKRQIYSKISPYLPEMSRTMILNIEVDFKVSFFKNDSNHECNYWRKIILTGVTESKVIAYTPKIEKDLSILRSYRSLSTLI